MFKINKRTKLIGYYTIRQFLLLFLVLFFALGCKLKPHSTTIKKTEIDTQRININKPFTTNANEPSFNDEFLQKWDIAHNSKDYSALKKIYTSSVFYYTKEISLATLVQQKETELKKNPSYRQQSIFVEDFIFNDRIELYFDKTYTVNSISKTIRSLLVLRKEDGNLYKISEESDVVTKQYLKKKNKQQSENADFNGDKKMEYAEIIKPQIIEAEMSCENEKCITRIQFSDAKIPAIEIENCIGGMLEIEGDLDNDGAVEIGIVDDWFTSRWGRYIVYTFKQHKWEIFTSLSVDRFTIMDDAQQRSNLVKKINQNTVEIGNFVWDDEREDMIEKRSVISIIQKK